ncbi:hypothetical protein SBV1_220007 [Verrucomicrobia bacterium]|nr:hypothetical protein SBV1_220007 [Verrucomicrobiota bacterium]
MFRNNSKRQITFSPWPLARIFQTPVGGEAPAGLLPSLLCKPASAPQEPRKLSGLPLPYPQPVAPLRRVKCPGWPPSP